MENHVQGADQVWTSSGQHTALTCCQHGGLDGRRYYNTSSNYEHLLEQRPRCLSIHPPHFAFLQHSFFFRVSFRIRALLAVCVTIQLRRCKSSFECVYICFRADCDISIDQLVVLLTWSSSALPECY